MKIPTKISKRNEGIHTITEDSHREEYNKALKVALEEIQKLKGTIRELEEEKIILKNTPIN